MTAVGGLKNPGNTMMRLVQSDLRNGVLGVTTKPNGLEMHSGSTLALAFDVRTERARSGLRSRGNSEMGGE